MILCEALNWLRANNATVYFLSTEITVHVEGQLFKAPTIEGAVERAARASAELGDAVAKAARRAFKS